MHKNLPFALAHTRSFYYIGGMKHGIHPKSRAVVFRDSGSGAMFVMLSTVETDKTIVYTDKKSYPLFEVEISSASHPFYTGKQKLVDTAGRVERFRSRYKLNSADNSQK